MQFLTIEEAQRASALAYSLCQHHNAGRSVILTPDDFEIVALSLFAAALLTEHAQEPDKR